MSARSLVVHKAVHPYRVAALNRWRAIVEAAARGESVSAEQERALYEAEMDAHDTMLSALAAPMSATPEGATLNAHSLVSCCIDAYAAACHAAGRNPDHWTDDEYQHEAKLRRDALVNAIAAHVAARVGEERERVMVDKETMDMLVDHASDLADRYGDGYVKKLDALIARCYIPEARDGE
jgi:hypothetical protein